MINPALRKKMIDLLRDMHHKTLDFVPGKTPIPVGRAIFGEEEIAAVLDSLFNGWLGFSNRGREFEKAFAKYIRIRYCTFVNSGSSANLLALDALKKYHKFDGGEIITPALTFPTTINPIIQLGFTPAIVDIDDTLNISPQKISEAIQQNTRGIIVPHILGNPAKINEIRKTAVNNNLFLIEDCCSALGSKFNGKKLGSFADLATYSFYAAHGMTTGEGGAVCTDDMELHEIIQSKRDWGRDDRLQAKGSRQNKEVPNRFRFDLDGLEYDTRYVYSEIGYNMKPLELQAAFGLIQLKKIEDFNRKRRENLKLYKEMLFDIQDSIKIPSIYTKSEPILMGLPLIIDDNRINRRELMLFLRNKNIDVRFLFAGNITKQPAYKNCTIKIYGDLKNTENAAKYGFWIGIHPGITKEMISFIASSLKEYCYSLNK